VAQEQKHPQSPRFTYSAYQFYEFAGHQPSLSDEF